MAQHDIDYMVDHLSRIKSGGHLNSVKIYEIELLEMELKLLRTFLKFHHVLWPDSLVKITKKAKLTVQMLHRVFDEISDECKTNLNMERLVSHLLEFFEGNTSLSYHYELNDSDLSEYMDFLGKNLNDLLMWLERGSSDLEINWIIKQLKIVQKKMRFLRYLYATEINGYVNHEKLERLETRIQFMASNVGQFCLAVLVYIAEIDDEDDDDIFSKPPFLICLIVFVELEMKKIFLGDLKASKFSQSRTFKDKKFPKGFSHNLHNLLVYLRNEKLKNFVSAQNIDVAVEFLLVFLGDVPNDVINGKRLNEILENIGVLVGDILCVIQMLLVGSTMKEYTSKIDLGMIQISEKIEDLRAQVKEKYKFLKYSPSNEFPTVGGLSFLDSLLRKLHEMLESESRLDFMMKPHICILEKDLSYLTSVFRDIAKVQHKHDEILKDLQRHTVNLAYEAEVSIDSILVQYRALWHFFCSLPAIIKEINHICARVTEMRLNNLPLKPFSGFDPSKHLQTQHSNPVNDEEIVGFENEEEKLLDYLTKGTRVLDVIPIVGMVGQGKTTIARKVYNNDIIVSRFDVRAWCVISQTYNLRELLQEILSQVTGSKDEGDKNDILADRLRKNLIGKRYLIVLDDMWDGMVWDDLRLSFPDVGNRSRIVVTTRLEEVAMQVKHHIDPYSLPFLTTEESCKLLQKKVFQQDGCPPKLQDLSLEIAKKCKGLPLVIILVAGIIKRNKMEASWWDEVETSLLSYLCESEGYSFSTIKLSYDKLPDNLKPCLLYMRMFPEDARIPVSKLISLWIAECFVENIESKGLEETAEGYLMDLISSNVVMVSSRRYNGKVKCCQVHDVVLHFCLEKSKQESRVNFNYSNELSKFASPFCHSRSLITTNVGEFYGGNPFHHVSEMRLLKVLDLSSHNVGCLSSATFEQLIHLKYLAVSTEEFHFNPESHLPLLETLIVEGLDKLMALPVIFWKMEKLRHVEITLAVFDLEEHKQWIFEGSSKLENLNILRQLVIRNCYVESMDVLLRRCPNLQELGIKFWSHKDFPEICLKCKSLTQLQILHLFFGCSTVLSRSWFDSNVLYFPLSLKKLVLRGIPVERVISFTAELPNLEYLQLWEPFTCDDSIDWCLPVDITFHNLKLLKLVKLGISSWDTSEESFPKLDTLVIKWCDKLEEIPFSFADIGTLKQIKLIGCEKKSLKASAEKIKENVKENEGNDRIHLIITDL